MRILVTGAAGFIGSHLAERLAQAGHSVLGLDCFTDFYSLDLKERNAAAVRKAGAELTPLNLAADPLDNALKGVEVVYHLAAQPGISAATHFDTYLRNNVIATRRLFEACRAATTPPFVVNAATSSVYGHYATEPETTAPRPVSIYGVTKLAAEALALFYDAEDSVPACSFRIFSVYGPRERPEKLFPKLISAALEGHPFPLCEGAGEHSRSFTYVADVVEAFLAALRAPADCRGEVFNVGSGEETRTLDAIRSVEALVGQPIAILSAPARAGDQIRTTANTTKIRERLGYAPTTGIDSGLRQTVAWFREQGDAPGDA